MLRQTAGEAAASAATAATSTGSIPEQRRPGKIAAVNTLNQQLEASRSSAVIAGSLTETPRCVACSATAALVSSNNAAARLSISGSNS